MTSFGKIASYDSSKGTGTISPESGGDVLPFRKSALQEQAQEPQQDQRFGFDVKNTDNGKRYADNLHQQSGEVTREDQARNQQG
jgi:CspA family cold shock protein